MIKIQLFRILGQQSIVNQHHLSSYLLIQTLNKQCQTKGKDGCLDKLKLFVSTTQKLDRHPLDCAHKYATKLPIQALHFSNLQSFLRSQDLLFLSGSIYSNALQSQLFSLTMGDYPTLDCSYKLLKA